MTISDSCGAAEDIKLISKAIRQLGSKPHLFAEKNNKITKSTLSLSKNLYSFASKEELPFSLSNILPQNEKGFGFGLNQLVLDGFNADQIWQQLQLRNEPFFEYRANPVINDLLGSPSNVEISNFESPLPESLGSNSELSADEADFADANSELEEDKDPNLSNSVASDFDPQELSEPQSEIDDQSDVFSQEERTEVDDDFFSLHKMHKLVEAAEEAELNDQSEEESDEDIDMNQDPDELDSEEGPIDEVKFGDFFKGPSLKKDHSEQRKISFADAPKDLLGDSDDDSEASDQLKPSNFEKKQQKMAKMIEQLEEENVSTKPWALMGEAAAWNRPKDSLLEEDLEFDHASKPAPVVTVEVTQSLEELIQQRILNLQFDDVVKPPKEKKKANFTSDQVELDMEKSKKSLAEVYEDEYQKATSGNSKSDDLPPELVKTHEEIDALFYSVCTKLDALSNSHYAPKMPKIEVQVVKDLPAISMEEAIPVAVSDATLLAPEEVYAQNHHGQAGLVQTSQELTPEERNRLRNRKKRLNKLRSKNAPQAPVQPTTQKS